MLPAEGISSSSPCRLRRTGALRCQLDFLSEVCGGRLSPPADHCWPTLVAHVLAAQYHTTLVPHCRLALDLVQSVGHSLFLLVLPIFVLDPSQGRMCKQAFGELCHHVPEHTVVGASHASVVSPVHFSLSPSLTVRTALSAMPLDCG